ncbi:InlB B-repeat-containing protein [Flavobacterium sp.]|uniref:InlB B-repeat-containing protein n=5 Tax=Flavobacterium sp. TaxID=239 RepID=UPI0040470B9F
MTNKLFKNLISQCYIVVFMLIGATNLLAQTTRNVSNYSELTSAISAAANGDIINFTTNIVIDNEITISGKTLTIEGNGNEVSVPRPGLDDMGRYNSSPSSFRVFQLSSGANVTINNLSIKGGAVNNHGGALYINNGTTIRLNNSIVSNSRANSFNGGGGIAVYGTAFFKNSYLRRNAASYGGGILVSGTGRAYFEESTMVENRSTESNGGGGAAECQSGSVLYFNNSTLSNNQSTEIGGAINNYRGTIYFINSSATGNVAFGGFSGGAIGNNGGNVYILNSLFAHNYRRTSGSVTNPTGFVLDDFQPYSSPGGIRIYHSIYHAALPASLGANTSNVQYTGASNGSNNSIFSGGLLSRITDTNGTEIGEQIYRPFLYNNQGSVAPTLQVGSFVSQTANRGVPTRFSNNNNNSPAIAYFSGGSWVNLLGTSASGQEVVQDQVGSSRNGSTPSRGAIESELDQVLYIVKVNGASGGTVNGGTIYGDVYQAGSSVTLTAIPNSGQQFVRWDYVAGGSGTASTSNPYTFTVNQDVTLIPVFSSLAAGSYTVTYVGNGNTSGTVPAVGTFTAATTIAGAGSLQRAGYVFTGWNTNSNGSGTSYAAGATYSAGTNLTLYAIWLNTISTPSVSTSQSFCSGSTVSDLVATGTDLKWYNVAEGGSPLSANTVLSTGTYYVTQSISGIESNRVAVEVSVYPRLTTISWISGPMNFTSDDTSVTYSVRPLNGATNYIWNLPSGLTRSSQTGPSITLSVSESFTSGIISVKAVNGCSETNERSITVRKSATAPGGIVFEITGNPILCSNTTQSYSATVVEGGTYAWTVPSGVTISSGQGTSSISITSDSGFVSGQLRVRCTTASATLESVLNIGGVAQPSSISGPKDLCGVSVASYSVTPAVGATYVWTLPSGMSITSGSGTASINVSIAPGTNGTVSVRAQTECGLSLARSLSVGTSPVLGRIIGASRVCGAAEVVFDANGNLINTTPSDTYTYQVGAINGVTNYNWTVPTGATIVSGQGTSSVVISYNLSSFESGIIGVQATNACGTGNVRNLAVSTVTGAITGPSDLCSLSTATYSVPSDLGADFVWTLPEGMIVTSGQGTSSITANITGPVNSNTPITVVFSTACGGTKTLTFNASCSVYTNLSSTDCGATNVSATQWVHATPVAGATSYLFNVYDATGSNLLFSVERPIYFFRFYGNDFSYGATYQVGVQVKQGSGTYGLEGSLCSVTLSDVPTTSLTTNDCGAVNVSPTQWISASQVPDASSYLFNIYDATGSNLLFSIERSVFFFRFYGSDFNYGTTYQVGVQVKQGSGAYGLEGSLCSVTIENVAATSLTTNDCGAVNVSPTQWVNATPVTGATSYLFNIYDATGSNLLFSIERPIFFFRFYGSDFSYGATYQVGVQAKRGSGEYGLEGSLCSVTLVDLPITSLRTADCGATGITPTQWVYTNQIPGATAYAFDIYDATGSNLLFSIERSIFFFRFYGSNFIYGTTYQVRVRVKQGSVYGAAGPACNVTIEDIPTTTLTQCGTTINFDADVYPIEVTGATGYAFDIYDGAGTTFITTIENSYPYFRFSQMNYTLGAKYVVKVRVKMGTQYGDQGTACLVQLNDSNARMVVDAIEEPVNLFTKTDLKAYPNPFTSTFQITPIEGETATMFYQVYDVTGKMIESRSVEANEIAQHVIGEYYPAGMYLVIVNQGAIKQTFKMVKQ